MNDFEKEQINSKIPRLERLFNKHWNPKNIGAMVARDKINKRTADFILEVYNVMKDVYPENSDLQVELAASYKMFENTYGSNHARLVEVFDKLVIRKLFIVVRFPEVEIVNSKKQNILIKDLFMRIPFTPDLPYSPPHFDRIQGCRMTVSVEEYAVNYRHSHLPRASWGDRSWNYAEYENFCTGEGDINSNQNLINAEYDPDLLRLMLMQLEPIAKWESVQGTPYIRINEVALKQKEYQDITQVVCADIFRWISRVIARDQVTLNLDWDYYNGKYRIKDNEKLEDFLREACVKANVSMRNFLCKDEDGDYFIENRVNPNSIGVKNRWTLLFKGENYPLTVYGEVKQTIDRKKYIHPTIKNYVKARFEFKANLYQATKVRLG